MTDCRRLKPITWIVRSADVCVMMAVVGCAIIPSTSEVKPPLSTASRATDSLLPTRPISFVGLTMMVPQNAVVTLPQGLDSNLLNIRGDGFDIRGDDYGVYRGRGGAVVAGQPATLTQKQTGPSLAREWEVKLPARSYFGPPCNAAATGASCHAPAGHIRLRTTCMTAEGCRTVTAVIASMKRLPRVAYRVVSLRR